MDVADDHATSGEGGAAVPNRAHDATADADSQPDKPDGSFTNQPSSSLGHQSGITIGDGGAGDRGGAHAGRAGGDGKRYASGERGGDEPDAGSDTGVGKRNANSRGQPREREYDPGGDPDARGWDSKCREYRGGSGSNHRRAGAGDGDRGGGSGDVRREEEVDD
jgi:hypothetical protein